MNNYFSEYSLYIKNIKKLSANSVSSYINDITNFNMYCNNNNINIVQSNKKGIEEYLNYLYLNGKKHSTVYRVLSSIKCYYDFLLNQSIIDNSPAEDIIISKREKNTPAYLNKKEIDNFLSIGELNCETGLRDKAILFLMFYCGLKVSEIILLKTNDINFNLNIIRINELNNKYRIIPFNEQIKEILNLYISHSRKNYLTEADNNTLFLNSMGKSFSRQGIWKMIKKYSLLSKNNYNVSPDIIRNSFAIYSLENGLSIKELKERLGYSDKTSVKPFIKLIKSRYDL